MISPEIAPLLGRAKAGIALTTTTTVAASAASIWAAISMASGLTHVLTRTPGVPLGALLTAAGALLLRGLLLTLRDILALDTGGRVSRRLRQEVLTHVFRLGPAHPWRGGRAGVQLGIVDGCEHLRGYLGVYLPQAIAAVVVPAVLVTFLLTISVPVALLVLVGVLLVPMTQQLSRTLLGRRSDEHWLAYEVYGSRLADSIAGLPTLSGLGAAQRRGEVLIEEAKKLRDSTTSSMRVSLMSYVVTSAVMMVGTAGATVFAAWQAAAGEISAGQVVLVLFLAAESFRPLQELQTFWHEGFYGLASARRLTAMLAERPRVLESAAATSVQVHGPVGLRLRGVSFRHPGADRDAVSGIDLDIPAGSTVALVGASGAGKTTLTRLLLRDLDPTTGSVHLELSGDGGGGARIGHDLRSLPLGQIRRLLARVDQEVVLLDGTVSEAVHAAAPAGTAPDHISWALSTAQVTALAEELPEGLQTQVGEGGQRLSGGQRQRVALARALVQKSPVLVLDEATSALDGENEALIVEALEQHRSDRTVVVIAHRLSTVARADLVVVLDAGRIVEQGTPRELAATDGVWTRMIRAQAEPLQGALQ